MLRSNVLVAGKFGLAGTLSILADSEINPLYKRQIHVAGGEEPKCRLWESSVKRLISRTAFCCALLAVALPADATTLLHLPTSVTATYLVSSRQKISALRFVNIRTRQRLESEEGQPRVVELCNAETSLFSASRRR